MGLMYDWQGPVKNTYDSLSSLIATTFDPISPVMSWHYQSAPLMITYDYFWLDKTSYNTRNNSKNTWKNLLHFAPI